MISSSLSTAPSISTTSTSWPNQSSEYEASLTPTSDASLALLGVHEMVEPCAGARVEVRGVKVEGEGEGGKGVVKAEVVLKEEGVVPR